MSNQGRGLISLRNGLYVLILLALGLWGLSVYWSIEPDPLPVPSVSGNQPTGVATTDQLIGSIRVLLNKPGGFISNDVMPPGDLMDNMPSWEYGALIELRAFTQLMRNQISRGQAQSMRDPDLAHAQPRLNVSHRSWMFPRAEGAYEQALDDLVHYRRRLEGKTGPEAHFYARAKDLRLWMEVVARRLGGLAKELEMAGGRKDGGRALTGPAQGSAKGQGTPVQQVSWWQVDNLFYRARGSAWALLNLCRGIQIDFHQVLVDKNALSTFKSLETTLAATQRPMYSPIVFSGDDFGLLANHTLTMAAFLATADATAINLQSLMQQD